MSDFTVDSFALELLSTREIVPMLKLFTVRSLDFPVTFSVKTCCFFSSQMGFLNRHESTFLTLEIGNTAMSVVVLSN